MGRLSGKIAIVTGAAHGLGKSLALKLADEGADLLIVTRNNLEGLEETKKLVQAKGRKVVSAQVDVSLEKDTVKMADLAVKEFGRIDILVNNAAIGFHKRMPFYEMTVEYFDATMAVNIRGVWLCIKAVFPQMKKQGKGKIVNIASETFFSGSNGFCNYVASKGGVIGLTRSIAKEVGDYGVCINSAVVGFLGNEAGLGLIGGDPAKYDVKPNCIKRVGMVEDVGGLVAFLASDEADFITGQAMMVDGGRFMH